MYAYPHTVSPDLLVINFPTMVLLCLWPSIHIVSLYPWVSLCMYLWPPLSSGTVNHKVPSLSSAYRGDFLHTTLRAPLERGYSAVTTHFRVGPAYHAGPPVSELWILSSLVSWSWGALHEARDAGRGGGGSVAAIWAWASALLIHANFLYLQDLLELSLLIIYTASTCWWTTALHVQLYDLVDG